MEAEFWFLAFNYKRSKNLWKTVVFCDAFGCINCDVVIILLPFNHELTCKCEFFQQPNLNTRFVAPWSLTLQLCHCIPLPVPLSPHRHTADEATCHTTEVQILTIVQDGSLRGRQRSGGSNLRTLYPLTESPWADHDLVGFTVPMSRRRSGRSYTAWCPEVLTLSGYVGGVDVHCIT